MRKYLTMLGGILLVACGNAIAIEVGSVQAIRFESHYTLDGNQMTTTRAKLENSSNFGPLGTVSEVIEITDILGPITTTALSTFDIFFIGYFNDGSGAAFTASELNAMSIWVEAGGTMIVTCDDTGYDAVCGEFGIVPSASNATEPVVPNNAGEVHPLFDGPFGAPMELDMSGTRKYFDDTGAFTVLAEDDAGNPVVLERLIGDGRVVAFTDVDIITNATLSEGTGIANDNDRFLGNLFAYLASEAVETFFINAGLNGNWWGGTDRRYEGFQVEVVISNNQIVVILTFYTYDTAGNPIFLLAVGPSTGNSASLEVYIYEGGMWGAAFDPDDVDETLWGTATFTTTSCNTAHISLAPNGAFQAEGYTNLAYDLIRNTVPAAPCPIALPD